MRFRLKHRTKRFMDIREKQKRLLELKKGNRTYLDSWGLSAERMINRMKKERKWLINESTV